MPEPTNVAGVVQLLGNTAYYREARLTTGGYVVDHLGCLISYYARAEKTLNGVQVKWDEAAYRWIKAGK